MCNRAANRTCTTAVLLAMMLSTQVALAGSHYAIIKGRTGTGRTQLLLHVQDIGTIPNYVKFTIDGKSFEITEKEIQCQSVFYDKKNRVYAVSLKSSRGEFNLWMIPASLKVITSTPNRESWTFTAVAIGTDPRQSSPWTLSPEIELACTLEWEM